MEPVLVGFLLGLASFGPVIGYELWSDKREAAQSREQWDPSRPTG